MAYLLVKNETYTEYEELPERILVEDNYSRTNLESLSSLLLSELGFFTLNKFIPEYNEYTSYLSDPTYTYVSETNSYRADYSVLSYSLERTNEILEENRLSKMKSILAAAQEEEDTATINWTDEETNTTYQIPVDDETKDEIDRCTNTIDRANDDTFTIEWNYDKENGFIELDLGKCESIGEALALDAVERAIKVRNKMRLISEATDVETINAITWS